MLTPIKDEQLLKALARLRLNEDFNAIVEYWTGELARLRAENDTAVGPQMMWNQGAAQVLSDQLLELENVQLKIHNLSQQAGIRRLV